jgi:quercetin dioxygenase-like cupin family protein
MQRVLGIVVFFMLMILSSVVWAEEYQNVEVHKLVTSTTASNGQPLTYLQSGQPEVTALVVHVPPGGSTGWHQHPVPVYAYMLEGVLNVKVKDGTTYSFKKGDAILELMNTLHNGYNPGREPASLVVFYIGAVGVPNVVKEKVEAVSAQP